MEELKIKSFPITGMSCAGCALSVESALNKAEGVSKAEVNYANSSVKIQYKNSDLDVSILKTTLNALGKSVV